MKVTPAGLVQMWQRLVLDHPDGYEVDIQLDGDRIVFPAEKGAAKRLLRFLNEQGFRDAIADTLYETNSKREAD